MKNHPRTGGKSAGATYLQQAQGRMKKLHAAIPALVELGQRMAEPLLAGGTLFTPATTSWFASEFCGRAGGLMAVRGSDYIPQSDKDVAFFALPDPRLTPSPGPSILEKLAASPAQLFVVGASAEVPTNLHKRIAGFTGGDLATDGHYAHGDFYPLVSFRALEQFARMWITTGEMITACIRAGKMPVLWMSVWLEGSLIRNAAFIHHNNVREPWFTPMFHENRYIPPLAPGYAATTFMESLAVILARLQQQMPLLVRAGQWMAQAQRRGHKIHAMAVGHAYPHILDIKNAADYPLQWWRPVSDLNRAIPPEIGKNEVVLHLGYAPVNVMDVQRILDRGVKLIYTTPYGRPATLPPHPNLLWFDLPWRPTDATVDIPGYSVRMLPMSSSAQSLAYNAILAELAHHMDWLRT